MGQPSFRRPPSTKFAIFYQKIHMTVLLGIIRNISCKVWHGGSIVHMFLFNVVGGLNAFEGFFDSYSGPNNNVMQ